MSNTEIRIGRYSLYTALASGGMATVYLGRMRGAAGFTRTIAIKRLHKHHADATEFVSMFVDEARVAARIHHPNVVQTLDVVNLDGEILIVMEYVHGAALNELLRRAPDHRIDWQLAGAIVAGLLQGLHAAHTAKSELGEPLAIVHRDVSPQNVLVGSDGIARVLDFGVAKARNRSQSTRDGSLKGKLAYMAPEQILSEPVDARTDVYAAGVVLFEAITGKRWVVADGDAALIMAALTQRPPSAASLVADLPPAVDEIIAKATAPKAGDRFATAMEMVTALEDAGALVSPNRVGRFVAEIASAELEKRQQQVSAIERAGHASDPEIQVPSAPSLPVPEEASKLTATVSTPLGSAKRRSMVPVLVAALAVIAVLAGVTLYRRPMPEPATGLVAPPVETTAARSVPSAEPSPAAPASPSAIVDAGAEPKRPVAARPGPAVSAKPKASASASAAPDDDFLRSRH